MPKKSSDPKCSHFQYITGADRASIDIWDAWTDAMNNSPHKNATICPATGKIRLLGSEGRYLGTVTFNSHTEEYGLTTLTNDGSARIFEPFKKGEDCATRYREKDCATQYRGEDCATRYRGEDCATRYRGEDNATRYRK